MMTEPRPSVEEFLAARYGTRSPQQRRRVVAAVVALAVAAIGLLGWIAWEHSTPAVQGELKSYDVVSDHEVEIVIAVDRDDSDAVECTVSARAADHLLVGEQIVTIPAGQSGSVEFETSIPTEREATSVTVTNCR